MIADGAIDVKATAEAYLEAFRARDLDRCLGFFTDQANLDFQLGVFKGLEAIADWHRDRWAANLEILKVESVNARGRTVVVDIVVASDRLRAWKLQSLNGRATLTFLDGRICNAKFAPRMMNPIELIRSGQ